MIFRTIFPRQYYSEPGKECNRAGAHSKGLFTRKSPTAESGKWRNARLTSTLLSFSSTFTSALNYNPELEEECVFVLIVFSPESGKKKYRMISLILAGCHCIATDLIVAPIFEELFVVAHYSNLTIHTSERGTPLRSTPSWPSHPDVKRKNRPFRDTFPSG